MKRLLCALAIVSVIPAVGSAQDVAYIYDPGTLTYQTASGTYNTSMIVSGQFQIASPLPASSVSDLSGTVSTYSFFDGVQTLDENNSYIFAFSITTDSARKPIRWGITLYRNNGGNLAGIDIYYSDVDIVVDVVQQIQLSGFTDGVCTQGGTPDNCQGSNNLGPNLGQLYAFDFGGDPGMWFVDCNAVTGGIQPPDRCGVCYGDGSTCLVFEDGFESDGTSVWSSSVP